jgi:hypothetical protein
MNEYLENGVSLGWLIDPRRRLVYIYRSDKEVEILDDPEFVSGEPLLKDSGSKWRGFGDCCLDTLKSRMLQYGLIISVVS